MLYLKNEFMNRAVFFHADCEAVLFLVRLTLSSISLTFKCQSTAVLLVGPLAVARRIL